MLELCAVFATRNGRLGPLRVLKMYGRGAGFLRGFGGKEEGTFLIICF